MRLLHKKNAILFLITIQIFSSCASILNTPVQKISISTDKNIQLLSIENVGIQKSNVRTRNATHIFYVERSKDTLKVNLKVDSTKQSIYLAPKKSFAYWFNIYSNYGIGLLVDNHSIKRYAYSAKNYLSIKDSSIYRQRFAPIQKGTTMLSFSFPFTTIFNVSTNDKQFKSVGFLGVEAGVEYFYKQKKYVSIHVGAATDQFAEHLGVGYFESATTMYTSIRNNRLIGSFDLGYGIHFSQLQWNKQTVGDTIQINQTLKKRGLGLSLSVHYRIGDHVGIGVLYQPVLFNTNSPVFKYQHFINLNLAWKLPL